MAKFAIVGFFILAVACGVGFSVASADSTDELARSGAFGFDEFTHEASQSAALHAAQNNQGKTTGGSHALCEASVRTIDAGFSMIDEREAYAREHAAEDDIAVLGRVEKTQEMQKDETSPYGEDSSSDDAELSTVDWTCGKQAFVAEWSQRIDAYLAGSELSGYGEVFAEAAWNNGVDPRWSPAISNTESGKGKACIRPFNAWGWGAADSDPRGLAKEWASWETAVRDHVAGLARVYGYSITPEAARIYCPPNYANWYTDTLNQMASM